MRILAARFSCFNLSVYGDPPGDVEEWEANAVFDEDGEAFKFHHWFTEDKEHSSWVFH